MFDYVKADGSCSEAAWLHVGAYFHRNRGRGRLAAALRILVPPASFRGGAGLLPSGPQAARGGAQWERHVDRGLTALAAIHGRRRRGGRPNTERLFPIDQPILVLAKDRPQR